MNERIGIANGTRLATEEESDVRRDKGFFVCLTLTSMRYLSACAGKLLPASELWVSNSVSIALVTPVTRDFTLVS